MRSKNSFLITPRGMFEKMKCEFKDFTKDNLSERHAINFVFTAYHLKEWTWKSYLKDNETLKKEISTEIQNKTDYYSYVNKKCPEMKVIRALANNTKHLSSEENEIKEVCSEPLVWGQINCNTWENLQVPWGYKGFRIITKENYELSALKVFQKTHDYWVNCFDTFFKNCT